MSSHHQAIVIAPCAPRARHPLRAAAIGLLAGVLLVLAPPPDAGAQPIGLLRLEGISGTSEIDDFEQFFDIDGFATGIQTPIELKGGAAKVGKPVFGPIEITKPASIADPQLFTRAASLAPMATGCIANVVLVPEPHVVSAVGLANVRVQALSPTLTPGGVPQQSVSLSYERIAIIAYRYSNTGGLGSVEVSCWDAAKNVSCGTDALGCTGVQ